MGCDIHMWVEVRSPEADAWGNRPWAFLKTPPQGFDEFAEEHGWDPSWYSGRNYDAFAMLASVRNGVGFAGIKTGEGFKPIAMPRGIPEDATDDYKVKVEEYGIDGHSHSWLTLRELQEYPAKDLRTQHEGTVGVTQFSVWKKEGKPKSWSGGVFGQKVEMVDHDTMQKFIDEGTLSVGDTEDPYARDPEVDGKSYYTRVSWEETYFESAPFLFETLIPELEKIDADPDDIRIVFYFDN